MDKHGHIYQLSDEERKALADPPSVNTAMAAKFNELREDVARLDGYLRGRAESDAPKRGPGANKDLAG